MKHRRTFELLVAVLGMQCAAVASADSASGVVVKEALYGNYADRGICVQLLPSIPGTGWACVWKDNALYKEITAALLAARNVETQCDVGWDATDSEGHKIIVYVSC